MLLTNFELQLTKKYQSYPCPFPSYNTLEYAYAMGCMRADLSANAPRNSFELQLLLAKLTVLHPAAAAVFGTFFYGHSGVYVLEPLVTIAVRYVEHPRLGTRNSPIEQLFFTMGNVALGNSRYCTVPITLVRETLYNLKQAQGSARCLRCTAKKPSAGATCVVCGFMPKEKDYFTESPSELTTADFQRMADEVRALNSERARRRGDS